MQNPTQLHVDVCKHIFHYLRGTLDARITYDGGKNSSLIGYSDADWGENRDNWRSTTGYVFLMADGAVTWASRMQKTVARSSTEAEYIALSEACSEIAWLIALQREIGYGLKGLVPLVADNQGGIFLAVNPAHDRRLKRPGKDTLNGERHKATAKLVRLLTNHAPIGEFRDRFNLDGLRICHACDLKVPDTREHMVYECGGWMHGFWKCIQGDPRDDQLEDFCMSSEHRV